MPDQDRENFGVDRQPDWRGGVIDWVSLDLLDPTQSARLKNAEVFTTGRLRRRLGLTSRGAWKGSLTQGGRPHLLQTFRPNGKRPLLCGISSLSDVASSFFVDDDVQVREYTSPHMFGDESEMVQFLNRIYILEPGKAPLYWQNGNSQLKAEGGDGQTNMPFGGTGLYYRGRGYVGGVAGKEDLLYFSTGLGTSSSTGEANVRAFDWDQSFQAFRFESAIQKILPYRNFAILVFTDRTIEIFEPDQCDILNSVRNTLSQRVGTKSKHSVQIVGEDIYFLDQAGQVRSVAATATDEPKGVTNAPVSLPVRGVFNRVDLDRLSEVRSTVYRGIYVISIPISGGPHETWLYSVRDQAWSGPIPFANGIVPRAYHTHRFFGEDERLYTFTRNGTDAEVFEVFRGGSDDGSNIALEWESRSFTGGNPAVRKVWNHCEFEARRLAPGGGMTIGLEIRMDEGDWQAVDLKQLAFAEHPILGTAQTVLPFRLKVEPRQRLKFNLTGDLTLSRHGYTAQVRMRHEGGNRMEILNFGISSQQDNLEFN